MLINTTSDFKLYVKVNKDLQPSAFLPFVPDAEFKYVRPWLGDILYNKLNTYYNADPLPVDDSMRALLPYAARASARFTLWLASPSNDLQYGENGFVTSSSTNTVAASAARVERFITSIEQLAWDAIEEMLRFLELNKEGFPDWVASEAYTLSLKSFINSAEHYNKLVNALGNSRLTFSKLRSTMDNVEKLLIEPIISVEFAEVLRTEVKNGSLSAINKGVYDLVCAAVANLSWHEYNLTNDEKSFNKFEVAGKNYLAAARKLLDLAPNAFPEYMTSGTYIAENVGVPTFTNSDSTKKAIFFY